MRTRGGGRLNRGWVQQATPIPQTLAKNAFLKDKIPSQDDWIHESLEILKYNKLRLSLGSLRLRQLDCNLDMSFLSCLIKKLVV